MRVLALGMIVGSALMALTSCASSASNPPVDIPDGGHLYTVARATISGGMCPYGECTRSLEILSDGRMILEAGDHEPTYSSVSSGEVEELQIAISQADVAKLSKQPDDYTCPIAYDGSMTTYEFYGGDDPIVVDTCEYKLMGFEPAVLVENQWRTLER